MFRYTPISLDLQDMSALHFFNTVFHKILTEKEDSLLQTRIIGMSDMDKGKHACMLQIIALGNHSHQCKAFPCCAWVMKLAAALW